MTDIISAIKALDANAQVVVNGEPSNQAEYESQVKFISGADENGSAIYKDTQDFTWNQVSAKKAELQTAYDNNEYQRKRADAYPSVADFMEAYTEKEIGSDSTKWDAYKTAYNKVRSDNPKG